MVQRRSPLPPVHKGRGTIPPPPKKMEHPRRATDAIVTAKRPGSKPDTVWWLSLLL
jgi:hypothetical protein